MTAVSLIGTGSRAICSWFQHHKWIAPVIGWFSLVLPPAAWTEPVQGLLIYGSEVHTLQPCGSERQLWVIARRQPLRQQLQQRYQNLVHQPYEPIYAELEGEIRGKGKGEFSHPYAGTLEVSGIVTISRDNIEACRGGHPPPSKVQTFVFECGNNESIVLRTLPEQAWIFLPQGGKLLFATPFGNGRKYAAEGVTVEVVGDKARIRIRERPLLECINNHRKAVWENAKLNGADFRAVGNEPGWLLLLTGDRIILETDYGTHRIEVPRPQPLRDPHQQRTLWKTGKFTLEISPRPCQDTMAGESYESTVVIKLPDQTLQGCGKALH